MAALLSVQVSPSPVPPLPPRQRCCCHPRLAPPIPLTVACRSRQPCSSSRVLMPPLSMLTCQQWALVAAALQRRGQQGERVAAKPCLTQRLRARPQSPRLLQLLLRLLRVLLRRPSMTPPWQAPMPIIIAAVSRSGNCSCGLPSLPLPPPLHPLRFGCRSLRSLPLPLHPPRAHPHGRRLPPHRSPAAEPPTPLPPHRRRRPGTCPCSAPCCRRRVRTGTSQGPQRWQRRRWPLP